MNVRLRRIQIIFMFLLVLFSGHALNADNSKPSYPAIRDAIDVVITAVGTQLPDYNISSVLASVPASTKAIITFDKNTLTQTLLIEAMDHPEKQQEIDEQINRIQAINSALNMNDSSHWEKIVKKEREKAAKKGTNAAQQKKDKEAKEILDEERDSLDSLLDRMKTRIADINQRVSLLMKKEDNYKSRILPALSRLEGLISDLNSPIRIPTESADKAKELCKENAELQSKIFLLGKAVVDGNSLVDSKIQQARERAANCKTKIDSDFVKSKYQASKDAVSVMKQALAGARQYLQKIVSNKKQIHDLYSNATKESQASIDKWLVKKSEALALVSEISNDFTSMNGESTQERSAMAHKLSTLETELTGGKQYYSKVFPTSVNHFNLLQSKLVTIRSRLKSGSK